VEADIDPGFAVHKGPDAVAGQQELAHDGGQEMFCHRTGAPGLVRLDPVDDVGDGDFGCDGGGSSGQHHDEYHRGHQSAGARQHTGGQLLAAGPSAR
tara:strand:+ start:466 stop:756 length:291 start_codon:yes stop_codon:yes gene_type:complete